MRRYLLAAAALAAIATPAAARDGSPYLGIEGGLLFPRDGDIEIDIEGEDDFDTDTEIDYKRGRDLDIIGGYDFGGFRIEGEVAFKRTRADEIEIEGEDDLDVRELDNPRVKVRTLMLNALGDFGAGGFGVYAGAGIGRARLRIGGAGDGTWAGQLIGGVRTAITPNIDAGLKYRFLRTRKFNFRDDFEFDPGEFIRINQETRFSSHSLLASLIFNFGAPAEATYVAPVAAPPPPPPVAPATQTCPDGSLILATDICPAPPPPPPPPPPGPERG